MKNNSKIKEQEKTTDKKPKTEKPISLKRIRSIRAGIAIILVFSMLITLLPQGQLISHAEGSIKAAEKDSKVYATEAEKSIAQEERIKAAQTKEQEAVQTEKQESAAPNPTTDTSEEVAPVKKVIKDGNSISNDSIKLGFTSYKQIILGTTGGDPQKASDDNKSLLYGFPGASSSVTTIQIDGKSHKYGVYGGEVSISEEEASITNCQEIEGIQITQEYKIVENPATGKEDCVKIRYTLKNTSEEEKSAGIRIMLDTMLGDNDAAPFRIAGYGSITKETEFTKEEIPRYWQAFDSLVNPTVTAQGTFYRSKAEKPDKVQFINWHKASKCFWEAEINPKTVIVDSAVTATWDEKPLAPGESREYVSYYGLSEFTEDLSLPLALSVYSDTKLETDGSSYTPNPIDITAYIQNISEKEAEDVTISIELPKGLSLYEGEPTNEEAADSKDGMESVQEGEQTEEATKTLGTIAVNEIKEASWKVTAGPVYEAKVYQYKVRLTTKDGYEKVVSRSIYVPALEKKEGTDFPYTIYSGSRMEDFCIYGWKSNITGDVYAGRNINAGISELYIKGTVNAAGTANLSGWQISTGEINEQTEPKEMPDFDAGIIKKAGELPVYGEDPSDGLESKTDTTQQDGTIYIKDNEIAKKSIYSKGNVNISETAFTGDCYIIAEGDITYNVCDLDTSGRLVLYSKNGNVTINGTDIKLTGILYAPKGKVTFNTYQADVRGRIIADTIALNDSIFDIEGSEEDLALIGGTIIKPEPAEVEIGADILSYVKPDYETEIEIQNKKGTKDLFYTVYIDGKEIPVKEDGTFTLKAPSAPGKYEVTITGEEPNGGCDIKSYTITVDDSAPVIRIEAERDSAYIGDADIRVFVSVQDDNCLDSLKVYVDDQEVSLEDEADSNQTGQNEAEANEADPNEAGANEAETNEADPNEAEINEAGQTKAGKYEGCFYIKADAIGTKKVRVTADDAAGNESEKEKTFYIEELPYEKDQTPPEIEARIIEEEFWTNDTIHIILTASDDSGEVYTELYADGKRIDIDEENTAALKLDHEGVYEIKAVARDAAGNETSHEMSITVVTKPKPTPSPTPSPAPTGTPEPAPTGTPEPTPTAAPTDTPAPIPTVTPTDTPGPIPTAVPTSNPEDDKIELTAFIETPEDGASITAPLTIKGIAGGKGFTRYELSYAPVNSDNYRTLKESNNSVYHDTLGSLDTTMLNNGLYKLRLTAYAGNTGISDEIVISVEGQMKIGNYSIAFKDIEKKVSGAAFTVIRSYDSRDKEESGDFGYGWKLTTGGASIEVSQVLGKNWYQAELTGAYNIKTYLMKEYRSHIVTVYFGDGTTEKFKVKTNPESALLYPLTDLEIALEFEPLNGGTSTLEALDCSSGLLFNGEELYDEEYEVANPTRYKLTKQDKTVYIFNVDGGLESITDASGNTLTFHENGISHSDGKTIAFIRDERGRITKAVSDDGSEIRYTYDENGDLVSVTDAAGYETTFAYKNHNLVEITDARGVQVVKNIYDDDGRLIKVIDAEGNETVYAHDIEGREELVTDRLGNVSRYIYDDYGNVISQTDAMGNTTSSTYDEHGNVLTKTDALGNVTEYTYDKGGNVTSVTDAAGNTINSAINSMGQVVSLQTEAEGDVLIAYDDRNHLSKLTDAEGNEQNFTSDRNGNVTGISDAIGTILTAKYDKNGNTIETKDASGNVTKNTYDENGNLLTKTIHTVIGDSECEKTIQYVYDENGKLIQTIDDDGLITTLNRDSIGQLISAVDSQGRETSYEYDNMGNRTKITYSDGTSEHFTYDAEGNLTGSVNRYGLKSTYQYDKAGNLILETDARGNQASYEYDANYNVTKYTSRTGAVYTYTYDELNRNTAITDSDGNTTRYEYDKMSHMVCETDANGNKTSYSYDLNGNIIRKTFADGSTISAGYDSRGRQISATDELGRTTQYCYDESDRLVSVKLPDGSETAYTYDAYGNLITVTDANGNTTTYGYDKDGHLTESILADKSKTAYTYDKYGKLMEIKDASGVKTVYTYDEEDKLIKAVTGNEETAYAYDSYGRPVCITTSGSSKGSTTSESDKGSTTSENDNGSTDNENAVYSKSVENSSRITYTYSTYGELTGKNYENGDAISYCYDKYGRLTKLTVTTAGGKKQESTYRYDKYNRITGVTSDMAGKVSDETAASDKAEVVFDGTEAVSDKEEEAADKAEVIFDETEAASGTAGENAGKSVSVSYGYDRNGNRKTATYGNGIKISYRYDVRNRLTEETVIDSEGEILAKYTYTLNAAGERTHISEEAIKEASKSGTVIFGRVETDYTYDICGRLIKESRTETTAEKQVEATDKEATDKETAATATPGDVTEKTEDTGNTKEGADKQKQNTERAESGQNTNDTEGIAGINGTDKTDETGRTDETNSINETYDIAYTYDKAGNRLSKTENGIKTEYTYNCINQLISETCGGKTISYTYDAVGNLISKSGAGVNESYSYDNSGRLTGYTNGSVREVYTYDAEGARRSKKTVESEKVVESEKAVDSKEPEGSGETGNSEETGNTTTYFINDYTGSISLTLAETDESGSLTASYIRADELIGQIRGGQISYYLFAGHGDVRALVNEEGSITDTYSYTAYGELTARTGDTENHYLYTGEYYDGASGLYYLRARYMNPGTGSFISMDSYTGSIYDPASLHRYTYVKDNPVMYKDPSGYIAQSLGETSIATGIKGILDNIVQINALAILNGITNAFISNLMGDSFSTQMKEFVKGFLCGFGLYSFAYFINAIYAISVLEILVVDALAREASSAVMIVVSACDGDSSSVVKYEMQAAMYMLASVLLYRGTLPKNDMKPSKNGWNCDVENAGSVNNQGSGGTKDIYRAVSPEEYEDIFNEGRFRASTDGKSLKAKEFGNSFEETLDFANKSINSDKAAIIKVTIPEKIYEQLNHMNLDIAIFKSGTPVVEPEMLDIFNREIIKIEHIF